MRIKSKTARGGLGLCSPCVIAPASRVPKPFWEVIRSTLLYVCNINLLTAEKIWPIDMLNVLRRNFLDMGGAKARGVHIGISRGGSRRGHNEAAIFLGWDL